MATEHVSREAMREENKPMEIVAGGSLAKGAAGIAAIALSIIGLSGMLTEWMGGIATILVGIALLFEGGAIGARFSALMSETHHGDLAAIELGGGMTAEFLAGVAGIVLGILSLLGIFPMILVPVAAIVFGGTLLLSITATSHLDDLQIEEACPGEKARTVARLAVRSAEGLQVFIGLGSLVLGILATIGLVPLILSLVAMLSVGFYFVVRVTAVSERMLSAFHCG